MEQERVEQVEREYLERLEREWQGLLSGEENEAPLPELVPGGLEETPEAPNNR